MNWKKTSLLVLVSLIVIIQFIRPEKNLNGTELTEVFEQTTMMPEEVSVVMQQNCYDCHSNQTIYPWYAEIAPVSWLVADHVEEGKEHFNVANWNQWDLKKKDHKLDELIEEVEEGHMPEKSYTWLHGNMTPEQKTALIAWARNTRKQLSSK